VPEEGFEENEMRRVQQLTGRILIVEDEPGVQKFLGRLVGSTGAEVEMASTGKEALQALPPADDVILAILDLNLPDASGLDLLGEIRKTHPALPVLLSSGYDESELPPSLLEDEHLRFLRKPYQIAVFWETFDSVLEPRSK